VVQDASNASRNLSMHSAAPGMQECHAPTRRRAASDAYLPAVDGFRAVSILLVVVSHLGLDHVVPGAFGVTLFFFISGYLITRQLAGGLAQRGRLDLARFYVRRVLRLMPAASVFVLAAGAAYLSLGGHISLAAWVAALFYGANYFDLWAGYRSTLPAVRHPFNILWSLAIEEHFYAVWPLALGMLWRRHAALWAVLALCLGVLAWRFWLLDACFHPGAPALCGPPNPNLLWHFNRLYLATDARLDSLGWGVALALLEQRGRMPPRWLAWPAAALLAASFIGTGPMARDVLRPSLQGVALLGGMPVVLAGQGVLARLLAASPCVFVGRLSYSLYLWHWGALMLADALCPPRFGPLWLGVGISLSVLLALASFFLVERPMLALRRRFGSNAR
jgi:peptidoglycan/LPS O-acetylase OafA/YrhL